MKAQVVAAPQKTAALRDPPGIDALGRRHLVFGWWTLLIFLSMGLVLEALHAIKVQSYLGVHEETRRLMWTLAHAHGTLLGVLNLGFAYTLRFSGKWTENRRNLSSVFLRSATILMPAGFFLGGWFTHAGDPGLGILMVPFGGILLFLGVLLTALGLSRDT